MNWLTSEHVIAVAAVVGIMASLYATRKSFNGERDALRASMRPIIVEGIGGGAIIDADGDLNVPIRNVGPGVAAIRNVKIGEPGKEGTGICDQQVIPHDTTYHFPTVTDVGFDRSLQDVSVRIWYEGVERERFETNLLLRGFTADTYSVVESRVYFCKRDWTRREPPYLDSSFPDELRPKRQD